MIRAKHLLLIIIVSFIAACESNKTLYIPSYYGPQLVIQGIGEAALPDSSIYQGEFKDGLFHGAGVITWDNSDRYEGSFSQGLLHGFGVQTLSTGNIYRGEFKYGYYSGQGELEFKDGDRYQGTFENNAFNGLGIYMFASGDQYHGEFINGSFSGEGNITYASGDTYEGDVKDWMLDGEGVYLFSSGKKYHGIFKTDRPDGEMVVEYEDGDRYEGGMNDWDQFHGYGRYTTSSGDVYDGEFKDGLTIGSMTVIKASGKEKYEGELRDWQYHGKGILTTTTDDHYDGMFESGLYNGQGKLVVPDVSTYTGEFNYGRYQGQGTLEYTNKQRNVRLVSGEWKRGKYIGDDVSQYVQDGIARLDAEAILFDQSRQVDSAIDRVSAQLTGKTDLFFVSFGSHGSQDVFMNEVIHASNVMDDLYGVGEKTVNLVNNYQTLNQYPLATTKNLQAVLAGVAEKMDVEEDLLFLYLTSHGSKDHQLSVELGELPLQEVSSGALKRLLDDSGIKWKVIVVSACYSGGFIDVLKDDYSLIITSARADRASFGCSNDAELTYFGSAFFKDSLKASGDFIQAFHSATKIVEKRELAKEYKPSMPQINYGLKIEEKLKQLTRKLQ